MRGAVGVINTTSKRPCTIHDAIHTTAYGIEVASRPTWDVFHRAESKSLLHLIFVSDLVPRGSEIWTHNALDVISHHHI